MDKNELAGVFKDKLQDAMMVVLSNREPYVHVHEKNSIRCIRPASGMAVALDSIMQACGGLWVSHGAGNADEETVDETSKVMVPPKNPAYALKRVWMTKKEEEGYYDIVSNEMFWPLCHTVYIRPKFDERAWRTYRAINRRFVDALLEEIGDRKAFVWFQDFHLSLAPKMLKDRRPDIVSAHFWHIPWPQNETFRACPWKNEILEGLLANDIMGFHTRYHCNNFLETVDRNLESRTDKAEYSVSFKRHKTYVHPFPISVDYDYINGMSQSVGQEQIAKLRQKEGCTNRFVVLGVERIDYTKGIPEKLNAIDWFLTKNPDYRGKFTYIQIGSPSRIRLEHYKDITEEIDLLVERINWKHGTNRWHPIIYRNYHHDMEEIIEYYKMADCCIVSSLHDGMNLVAKEYISAKTDDEGILILSKFTGASEELDPALKVNPYDTRRFAKALKKAIKMKEEESTDRMRKLRWTVSEHNIYTWAEKVITQAQKIM
jgi:trehalose-6-phosphate synthase